MFTDKRVNNLTGWSVFLVSLVVYLLTMAPTASFWDCGEFIACANELEVTHPPGAPLFLLIGRLFAMLAGSNVGLIAWMVNLVSALASAFTAMLVCWTVTMLATKGMRLSTLTGNARTVAIMGSGVIAGLTTAFSDSFWFNAVEAEVYALSSFFTALVVWLMFKWEQRADQPDHTRYLILIAYVMGLSIGVHLLNLLTIPALALVFYFRKYEFSWRGLLATLGISIAMLAFIQYGIIQETFELAWGFERIFTGTVDRSGEVLGGMGMTRGTGALIFALLVVGILATLLFLSQRKRWIGLNTVVLGITVIMIGFSSYALVPIRSQADPAIDMNNPENLLTFLSYMRREQYGDRPLLRGPMYHAQPKVDADGYAVTEPGAPRYMLDPGQERYVLDLQPPEYLYEEDGIFWFPRMYDPGRYMSGPFGYFEYVADKGDNMQSPYDDHPTWGENFTFFLDYQLTHMYLRYLLWNFVGRESDEQDARWESGLEPTDGLRYLPRRAENKGKNHYYFLPLLLGLLGLVWQSLTDGRRAVIVGILFLLTGIAIILYLNQWPLQPRERDYSYAGSFQTFAMWVGLGALFLTELLAQRLKKWAPYVAVGISALVPLLMLVQNWDDHTRKGRWVDVEFAQNLLDSCEPNAILFTGGDNDTFSLWYMQEVEGYRTDVRVVNLELLLSGWYIDQMKQPKNDSPPLPITMANYAGEANMVIQPFSPMVVQLPADSATLVQNGVLTPQEATWADSVMTWEVAGRGNGRYLLRKDSVLINLLRNVATDGWRRPVYFANTLSPSSFLNLDDYLRLEGIAYRVVPVKASTQTPEDLYYGWIGQERSYKFLNETLKLRGMDDPSVNMDEHIREVIVSNYRNAYFRVARSYAVQVADWQVMVDSLVALPADSLGALRPEDFDRQISEAKVRIASLMEASLTRMPLDVIPQPQYTSLLQVQTLTQIGMFHEAEPILLSAMDEAIAALKIYHEQGYPVDQENMDLRVALTAVQFYELYQQPEQAEAIAERMKAETGNEIGYVLLEQMREGR